MEAETAVFYVLWSRYSGCFDTGVIWALCEATCCSGYEAILVDRRQCGIGSIKTVEDILRSPGRIMCIDRYSKWIFVGDASLSGIPVWLMGAIIALA